MVVLKNWNVKCVWVILHLLFPSSPSFIFWRLLCGCPKGSCGVMSSVLSGCAARGYFYFSILGSVSAEMWPTFSALVLHRSQIRSDQTAKRLSYHHANKTVCILSKKGRRTCRTSSCLNVAHDMNVYLKYGHICFHIKNWFYSLLVFHTSSLCSEKKPSWLAGNTAVFCTVATNWFSIIDFCVWVEKLCHWQCFSWSG